MAYTTADADVLRAAIASGVLRVTYGDPPRTVVYQRISQLQEALAAVEASLAVAPHTPKIRRYGDTRRGW